MAEVTQLVLAVDSRQVRTATGDLDKFGRAGAQTERQASALGRTFRTAQTAASAFAGSLVAREIIRAADGYKELNARLQLVSKNTQEFAKAQAEVLRIAQSTRVGLQQTGDLYGSLARSTQSLGVSQEALLGVTESINQALIISGTSGQSAAAALVQLGQGFASGALRGEELNSILEQAPRLAQAIADGLGVPIGKLRELGKAGELTAETVFGALQKSGSQLQAEFQRIPLTVGQATTQASNALSVLIGVIDESTGATEGLSSALSSAAGSVTELANEIQRANSGDQGVGVLAKGFTIASQTIRIFLADVKFVFAATGREIAAIAAQLAALARFDLAGFRAISQAVKEDAERARAELDRYQQQVLNPFLNSRGRGTTGGADPRIIGTTPANETVGFRPTGGGGGGGGGRRGGSGARTPQREQLSEAEKYLQNLRQQLEATADLSVQDALLRDIQLGRLGAVTPAQEQQLLAVARQIDEFGRLQEAERLQAEESRRAIEERNRVLEEGKQVIDSTRTPTEQLAAAVERLNFLYREGALGAVGSAEALENLRRGLIMARDQFVDTGKGIDDFAKRAGESIQKSLGDELTNILEGNFDSIGKSFTKLINRMIAEALAADLARAIGIGGPGSGGSQTSQLGGVFSSVLGSIFGGGFGTPPFVPSFDVGTNFVPRDTLAMVHKGEAIIPAALNRGGGSSGSGMTVFQNFSVQGPVDRRTEAQIAKAASRGLQSAQRNL